MDSNPDKRIQNRVHGGVTVRNGQDSAEEANHDGDGSASMRALPPHDAAASLDAALARALDAATVAGRFDVVA
jgi:hypothetical protein